MKNLEKFVNAINEAKAKNSWEEDKKDNLETTDADDVDKKDITKVASGGKVGTFKKAKPGKNADDNGTNGLYAVDPPTPEDEAEWDNVDLENKTENYQLLYNSIAGDADFFVQGEAGWAKTDLITKVAHQAGYHVITVYLDKAVATDLGGIPVPIKDEENGITYQNYAIPCWAAEMIINPKKYLLFFDEMNQAAPDVMNALMPIVLKHEICGIKFDELLVGAAGNYSFENDSVSDLNKPLMSRFDMIDWVTHTDEEWESHFEWAHKTWDPIIGAEVINKVAELKEAWSSPRDITRKIYKWCQKYKGAKAVSKPAIILKQQLQKALWEKRDTDERNLQRKLEKLAQYLFEWAKNGGEQAASEETSGRKKKKGMDQVNENDKKSLINSLKQGYFFNSSENDPENGDDEKYMCTVENAITCLYPPEMTGITAEVFKRILREMEASGVEPMFKTNDEGRKVAEKKGWHVIEEKDGKTYLDGEVMEEDDDNEQTMGFMIKKHIKKIVEPKKEEPAKKHTDD